MIHPVILSGGAGTRLWPLSTRPRPKQFLPLLSDKPLIIETAERLQGPGFHPPIIVSGEDYRFLAAQTFSDFGISPQAILLEPRPRDTAAAVAAAALHVEAIDPGGLILIAPSDHMIKRKDAFISALARATKAAEAGKLVTFGVEPSRPETEYGYIRKGGALAGHPGVCAIERFVEKPGAAAARRLIEDGRHLWNSGMFVLTSSAVLRAFKALAPEILDHCGQAYDKASRDMDFLRLDKAAFDSCPARPFDIAIMEPTAEGAVIPVDMGWSDIGAWPQVANAMGPGDNGNALRGPVKAMDTKGSLIWSDNATLTTVHGLSDMIVIALEGRVLVAPKTAAAEIGAFARLPEAQSDEWLDRERNHRPWGSYQTIQRHDTHLVKRLSVRPGARISLQYHNHRSEHWIVVEGTAWVTKGDEEFALAANESVHIPAGAAHRLENRTGTELTLIEVQSGPVLSEDDIVRLDDDWNRVPPAKKDA